MVASAMIRVDLGLDNAIETSEAVTYDSVMAGAGSQQIVLIIGISTSFLLKSSTMAHASVQRRIACPF